MSMIKISEYVFFLKTCYLGQTLLEKCYRTMQQFHRDLLLEARQQGGPCLKALKDLSPFLDDTVSSMICYLPFLEDQLFEQEARSHSALIPIWDYSLVLNHQQNIHRLLSKRDLQLRSLLKRLENTYQVYAWSRGLLWVAQLKKPQAAAQFINEKILLAFNQTQAFLDQIPIKAEAGSVGVFEAFMRDLKGYKASALGNDNTLKKSSKGGSTPSCLSEGEDA